MPISRDAWINLLQAESGEGLQRQLVTKLRSLILDGRLDAGSRLPSARTLATDLSVARITVDQAYARLESEGYLYRKTGSGTFVSDAAQHLPKPAAATGVIATHHAPPLSKRGIQTLASTACIEHTIRGAFNAGLPDGQAFPHETWQRMINQILRTSARELGDYGHPQGLLSLRTAIANWMAHSRGVHCTADQVLILTSSQQAIQLTATLLLDPGDTVAMENPGYLGARTALQAAGGSLIPIRVDQDGADPASLPESHHPRLVYLTPSHQYPLGHALSLSRRLDWLARAHRDDAWIIEDDYDGEFQYDHRPLPALQSLDREGRVIYIGTFSKVLFPSLRLAWMVLPGTLAHIFADARTAFDGHSSVLMQAVTAAFIEQGYFASHLRHMRQLYRSRRDLLLDCLQVIDDRVQPQGTASGLQFAVTTSPELEQSIIQAARGTLVLRPISQFHTTQTAHFGWLLGYSALDNQTLRNHATQLVKLVQSAS
ncbi:PLP-dependent aminotransferase family protein [Burkholderiaceae bacterium DAT-1]|nr:PLP-dependent aminotransferase family protein [Burkholderiaceae bacterium DAT-1]